jgi:hypothetical protein
VHKLPGDRGVGRPRLAADEKRDRQVALRLTAEERLAIGRWAALARLPVAVYARQAALQPAAPPRAVPIVNVRSYGQFGRLANNLNQLTKLAHEGHLPLALLPAIQELLAEVRAVRRLLVGLEGLNGETEGESE